MDQLLAMRVFRSIVDAKGFSAAAERLGTSHSTVSRQLKQLEATLGVQLINRNTRRFALTAAGERYFAASVDIIERVDAASQAMAGEHQTVAGRLRVSVPLAIGTLELADWLPAFQKRYPDLQLDLSCSDQFVDLVAEGFDVALRISGPLADTSLVARTLTVSDIVLVASPAYLAQHGLPRTPLQLAKHELLTFSGAHPADHWVLTSGRGAPTHVELNGRLTFDAITALYSAALAGAGIAAFTRHTVQTDLARGRLVHLLPGYSLGTRHYYALYPQTRYVAPKVRAFVDHMAGHYRER
ncbi:LysR family transcriptional regulator [Paraburkholderia madseniana]|uniref:LysR family transcriptional regulator n=1 Tax=Paraburkholderia madseniana TaxID=2599607 RepID=A0AAP5BDA2_9BURK|nr:MULTISPECIES: LysR family transcriptional regulator [Paraburkholderia]MCX4146501.1 LysR family transcriptional regulator [Paraburkholderia madseniana]MDN7149447.1 LysR family transcriptional regulator [Paraburkholderia sp. WS6]MDQ6408327.1 LysR family transcriptional regulator [Paraburkholderia madseniana]